MSEIQPDSELTVNLLTRIRGGDRRALSEVMRIQRPGLRAFVEYHLDPQLRARVDASDVVQETQMEVMNRIDDYLDRQPMPFRLWIRKQAMERMQRLRRDHLNRARRSVRREVAWPDRSSMIVAGPLMATTSSPSVRAERRETARRVSQVVGELNDPDREILMLRHAEDLPYAEIGCLLDIDASAARKRYGRALIRLQRLLTQHGLLESHRD